jgi:hypothetical protein
MDEASYSSNPFTRLIHGHKGAFLKNDYEIQINSIAAHRNHEHNRKLIKRAQKAYVTQFDNTNIPPRSTALANNRRFDFGGPDANVTIKVDASEVVGSGITTKGTHHYTMNRAL